MLSYTDNIIIGTYIIWSCDAKHIQEIFIKIYLKFWRTVSYVLTMISIYILICIYIIRLKKFFLRRVTRYHVVNDMKMQHTSRWNISEAFASKCLEKFRRNSSSLLVVEVRTMTQQTPASKGFDKTLIPIHFLTLISD